MSVASEQAKNRDAWEASQKRNAELAKQLGAPDFHPSYDRILVRKTDDPGIGGTGSGPANFGFAMPDAAKEKPTYAEVVAIGPGLLIETGPEAGKLIPLRVKVGDRIAIGKYTGTDIKIDGKEFSVMRETEALGVFGSGDKHAGTSVVKANPDKPDKRPNFMT